MSSAAMPEPADAVVADVMSRPVLTVEIDETRFRKAAADVFAMEAVSDLASLLADRGNADIRLEGCHPQLGAIPGHVWVIPGQPAKLRSIRADARRGEKVVALR